MTAPLTGDRQFRNEAVRLADLTVNTFVLKGYEFSNCRVIGPAILVLRDTAITSCAWEAPGLDAVFWEIAPGREVVIGAVLAADCVFSNCVFQGVGIAGPPQLRADLERGFS